MTAGARVTHTWRWPESSARHNRFPTWPTNGTSASAQPRPAYFKMDEALGFTGEFAFWSAENRDAKIRQMAKVIDRDDLCLLGVLLDVEAHERIIRRVWRRKKGDNRHSLAHPYMMLCDEVLAGAVKYGIDQKVNERMHLVYDDNAKYRDMFAEAYRDYLASVSD